MFPQINKWLSFVRFSHTLFALPFALAAMAVAARDNRGWPGWRTFGLILAAMVCARTCAMAFNRIVDRKFDALNPRTAMRELHRVCRPGAHFIFTTHDRDDPQDIKEWAKEAERWARGEQNPRLLEFGDRYFTDDNGNTFMHLPDRQEVLEDMAATGWMHVHDRTRNELASETPKVRNFSDNCRFWVAHRA